MKKVLLPIILLMSLAVTSQAVNPAHIVTASIESVNLGDNNDTIAQFTLGHVNFITDNSGSAEYKNGWIRNNTEWCLYRSYNDGPLLVQAEEGYWIQNLTLTYAEKSDGILSDHTGASQSKIAAYASGTPIVVNGSKIQFYVGKSKSGTGGYLTITKFAVTYCKSPDSLALKDQTVAVGDAFQLVPQVFPSEADTVFTWSSDNEAVVAVDSNGVINAKAAGVASVTVATGRVSASCQVTVRADSSASVVETFSRCPVEKNYTGTTAVIGDDSLYRWQLTNFQRQLTGKDDQVNGKQGIRVRYSGSIATDGVQEGGIKAIAFDWRTANSVNSVNYNVKVGEQYYEYNSGAVKNSTVYHFARPFEVKENTTFSVNMAAKIGDGQTYIIVSPVTITPYLLFNLPNHRDNISVGASGIYDLNKVLINNTNEEPSFTILGNTTGASTSIKDGVLSIANKTQEGEIVIQAAWNKGQVTTTMTLHIEDAVEPVGGEAWTETFSNCTTTMLFDGRVHVIGDQGIYDWSVARFQRTIESDKVGNEQGIRLRYNGSITSSGEQEGGIKELAFDWRITGPDMPVHFTVQVGSKNYDYTSHAIATTDIKHYICPCRVEQNAAIQIAVPAEEKPAQTYIVVGALTITPYLLFVAPNHWDTLRIADTTCYDLRHVLIDNTDSVGVITYEILSDATGAATIKGSVIQMGEVEVSGAVEVQASWQNVTTTMTLWVMAEEPLGINTPSTLNPQPYTKTIQNGHIRIYRGSACYTILGQTIY